MALLPLVVFLGIYLIGSIIAGDFYKIPITIAGMVASIVAVGMTRRPMAESVGDYSRGATDHNIMLMIWIFVLAGAFAASTKAMGAVDATVALTLRVVPEQFLPAGIFIAACFTSISIGTSVGTIVALTPIASAIATQTGCSAPWLVAIVVGGALFGDNLSFISDTTIAATRTQGCSMRDKFRTNVKIVTPAAIITLLIYIFTQQDAITYTATDVTSPWYTILPYLLVLVLSAIGTNVLIVLTLGILSSGIIGLACGQISLLDWFSTMGEGIDSMGQLIIITMMAGGMLEMIRINGGIDFIISRLTSRVNSRRAAEGSIAALVMFADICTANNTVAIISVGYSPPDSRPLRHLGTPHGQPSGHLLVLYSRRPTLWCTATYGRRSGIDLTRGDYPPPLLPDDYGRLRIDRHYPAMATLRPKIECIKSFLR